MKVVGGGADVPSPTTGFAPGSPRLYGREVRTSRIVASLGGLAAVAALVLSGCSAAPASDEQVSTAIITTNGSEPTNPLIPTDTAEAGGAKVIDSIFAGLIYYDKDGAPVDDLAETITPNVDMTVYTVVLRDDATFTNGEDVTATSFVDAWNFGALASNKQADASFFSDILGFNADEDADLVESGGLVIVDDYTFEIHLTSSLPDYPVRLGYPAFYPLPSVAYDNMTAYGQHPVGNGPYMFDGADAWQKGVKIDLVTNPDYDGGRHAVNGGLSIVFYADLRVAYADLLGGYLDVLDSIPSNAEGTYQGDLGDRAIDQTIAVIETVTIPSRLAHFAGQEGQLRRQAIAHAINRDNIISSIFGDTRIAATDFTSPVIYGYSDTVSGANVLNYDADTAKDLWAEADLLAPWDGTFEIAYSNDGDDQAWVDAVARSISNALGIDAAGVPSPSDDELDAAIADRSITTAFVTRTQADYPGLFNMLGPVFGSNGSANVGDYTSADFDEQLKAATAATTPDEASTFYRQAQAVLFRDLPSLPLWYSTMQAGYGDQVSEVAVDWHSVPLYYQMTKDTH
ncbi:ABC transporter substrate-binding protein [soil metagenome]